MKIADISAYQGNVDWAQASKELSFCILRASCGTAKDAKFTQNAEACARYGVPYHAYHYLKATDSSAAAAEAKAFYDATRGHEPIVYVVDCEHNAITNAENAKDGKAKEVVNAFVYALKHDLMEYLTSDGYSIEEATEIILNSNTKKMLEDFSGKLRIVQRYDYLEADEELIAYRLSVMEDEDYVVDMDFHFIVFRNGQWMSKLGTDVVESFDFTEKPWETPYFVYNSSIVYLAHKI